VRSILMVVIDVGPNHAPKLSLIDRDHLVQAISSKAADPSFRKSVLPRRSKSCAYLSEFKPIYPIAKLHPIDLVIVADQETAGQTIRTGFYYLLGSPPRSWMSGHVKAKDSPPSETQDKKHVENAETSIKQRNLELTSVSQLG